MPPTLRAAAALGVSYRSMTDADLPFADALYASTREDELAPTGWPDDAKRAFLVQQFAAQHRHYSAHYPNADRLIVEYGGTPVGRLYLNVSANEVRIVDISLLPACRGRGFGGAMLSDIIDDARAAGRLVSIHVEKFNPARRLYDRLGFRPVGEHGAHDLLEWRADEGIS